MFIEIRKQEVEALILERMRSGQFESVEEVVEEALKAKSGQSSVPSRPGVTSMGTELISAMQDSPFKEIEFERGGGPMPVRDV